ncbi:MAG TPA: glucan biosynthesis protein D [Caulobacteraceae bacterium]|nr:glucan biosynthesis protein D [Caulobacteraceae bacterium]
MDGPSRRCAVAGLLTLPVLAAGRAVAARPIDGAWPAGVQLGPARPFSLEALKAQALALSRAPYRPPAAPPAALAHAIDYDAFGAISYKPSATLWADRPGVGVRFFPLGRYAPTPVAISVVSGGAARPVLYSPGLFDAPVGSPLKALGRAGGFAGFKVMNADARTDWIAYLGASYFRSADPFNQYGLSARGIAIDTVGAAREEFPSFTAFWLEQAPEGLVVYALLDGPSVAGAFRIGHQRSAAGLVQDIQAELHFRKPVGLLGLAPLTSMYWYGPSDRAPADDWRPQIHDSDGLAIWTGAGERIWRPLSDPPRVMGNAFLDTNPRGYGLMQRDRLFADYQDDGAFYEKRPSAWVEPVGDWGAGSVQLVEIPTSGESEDNIVAFWTPQAPVTAGQSLSYRYRLHWTGEEPTPPGVARVVATRAGRGGRPGQPVPPGLRKIVIDFAGASLSGLTRQSGVTAVVTSSLGEALAPVAYPVEGQAGRWRLMFDTPAPPGKVVNLRAYLRRGEGALTETWIGQLVD